MNEIRNRTLGPNLEKAIIDFSYGYFSLSDFVVYILEQLFALFAAFYLRRMLLLFVNDLFGTTGRRLPAHLIWKRAYYFHPVDVVTKLGVRFFITLNSVPQFINNSVVRFPPRELVELRSVSNFRLASC